MVAFSLACAVPSPCRHLQHTRRKKKAALHVVSRPSMHVVVGFDMFGSVIGGPSAHRIESPVSCFRLLLLEASLRRYLFSLHFAILSRPPRLSPTLQHCEIQNQHIHPPNIPTPEAARYYVVDLRQILFYQITHTSTPN